MHFNSVVFLPLITFRVFHGFLHVSEKYGGILILFKNCARKMEKLSKRRKKRWNIPVPAVLDEAVEKAVELDMHATKSDLIREAVREKLEKMGFRIEPFKQEKTKGGENA